MINAIALSLVALAGAVQAPPQPAQKTEAPKRPAAERLNAEIQELRQTVRKLAARVDALEKQLQNRGLREPARRYLEGWFPRIEIVPPTDRRWRVYEFPGWPEGDPFEKFWEYWGRQWGPGRSDKTGIPTVEFGEDGSYEVTLNGKKIASGKADPKEPRATSIVVENGRYKVSVNGKVVAEGRLDGADRVPKVE